MRQWCLEHPYLTFALTFWCVGSLSNLLTRLIETLGKRREEPTSAQLYIVDPAALTGQTQTKVEQPVDEELN